MSMPRFGTLRRAAARKPRSPAPLPQGERGLFRTRRLRTGLHLFEKLVVLGADVQLERLEEDAGIEQRFRRREVQLRELLRPDDVERFLVGVAVARGRDLIG